MKKVVPRWIWILGVTILGNLSQAKDALDSWIVRIPAAPENTNQLWSVAYGNGNTVAVGRYSTIPYGVILNSTNGIDWQAQGFGFINLITAVCYGNGRFVAVTSFFAAQSQVYVSTNGADWMVNAMPAIDSVQAVTYGKNLFVAVGRSGMISTSPDGVNWTLRSSPTAFWIQGVAFGNNRYVAVGYPGVVVTSNDGVTWTSRSFPEPSASLNSIVYGGGLFVAAGQGIYTSSDGVIWTTQALPPGSDELSSITYGNGTFVAVGNSDVGKSLFVSTNGTYWTRRTPAPIVSENTFRGAVAFAGDRFVFVGLSGTVFQSASVLEPVLTGRSLDETNGFTLDVAGEVGRTYLLQYSTNLVSTNWTDLGFVTNNLPTVPAWDTNAPASPTRFYRAVIP